MGARDDQSVHWRSFAPAVLLLIIGLTAIMIATLQPSGRNGQYAVVAPPWYSLAQRVELVRQANGVVAEMRANRHIIVAQSDRPGFLLDLYRAGAWLVIEPRAEIGCGDPVPTTKGGRA